MDYSIRIMDRNGSPRSGVAVTAHYPLTWSKEFTDDDGWAYFHKDKSGVRGTVYAKGEELGEPWIEDGDTFSFTV